MKFLEAVGALSNSSEKTLNPLRAFAICCKVSEPPSAQHSEHCAVDRLDLEPSRCVAQIRS